MKRISKRKQRTERLIREHGMAVVQGYSFGMRGNASFRLSYSALQKETAKKSIRWFVAGLKSILRAWL